MEYTLKPSNYHVKPWFLHVTAQKSKYPRRFWELDPEFLYTCLMCPCRAFYECFFCFLFFFAENVGSLKTQISPKNTKTQISDGKSKNYSLKARQGHLKHVWKTPGSNSRKRRGHWHLKEFGVLCLNQPVECTKYLFLAPKWPGIPVFGKTPK